MVCHRVCLPQSSLGGQTEHIIYGTAVYFINILPRMIRSEISFLSNVRKRSTLDIFLSCSPSYFPEWTLFLCMLCQNQWTSCIYLWTLVQDLVWSTSWSIKIPYLVSNLMASKLWVTPSELSVLINLTVCVPSSSGSLTLQLHTGRCQCTLIGNKASHQHQSLQQFWCEYGVRNCEKFSVDI